jgi:hypothetical protein
LCCAGPGAGAIPAPKVRYERVELNQTARQEIETGLADGVTAASHQNILSWAAHSKYKIYTMKADALTQFIHLHSALLKEKAALEKRLSQIDRALGGMKSDVNSFAPVSNRATVLTAPPKRGGSRPRLQNPMSLKQAMIKATQPKPLSKPEILTGVRKLGYQFAGKNPMNSINVQLYTKGQFKKHSGGRFSPI